MKRFFTFMIILLTVAFLFNIDANAFSGDQYKVGVNDMLDIRVLGHQELQTITTVSSDGSITFPYIGTIQVKDMKVSEIQEEITKRLSEGYVNYPIVSVTLVKSLSKKIYSYGEVNKRGEIAFEEKMTLLEALSVAGGISQDGLYGKVKVRRKQKEKPGYTDIELDLKETIEGSATEEMFLKPDDILIVERNKTFFVHGEVYRPGEHVLEKDMTAVKALSVAGGIRENGTYGKIKVRRKQEGTPDYKDIEIDLEGNNENSNTGDMLLQPDDILIVERSKTFFVHGEVYKPGEHVLEKDMTAVKALSVAGGIRENGTYGKIKVRRKQEGTPDYKDIEIDLESSNENSETGDMLLQSDDILIVERNKTFFVHGEVNRPGEYALQGNMTVLKAMSLVGGFTKWGSSSRIKVLRPKKSNTGYETIKVDIDAVIDGDATKDTILQSGDIVVISRGIF